MRKLKGERTINFPALIEVRQGIWAEHERIVKLDELVGPKGRYDNRGPGIAATMNPLVCWFLGRSKAERTAILRAGREAHELRMASDDPIHFPVDGESPASEVFRGTSIGTSILNNSGGTKKRRGKKDLVGDNAPVSQSRDCPRPRR